MQFERFAVFMTLCCKGDNMSTDFYKKLAASRPRRYNSAEHKCARRAESIMFDREDGPDVWGPDDGCSFCGSLDPDVFMARIEAGDVILTPTDKNYKVYVRNIGGASFKQMFRDSDSPKGDDPTLWVWTTRETQTTKFYFQHLSADQRTRFIELHNAERLKLDAPGYFYSPPFFCGVVGKDSL